MRYVIYPFALHCEGAQALRDYLKEKGKHSFLAKREGNYKPTSGDFIIGWGCSKPPIWSPQVGAQVKRWINRFDKIAGAVDKRDALEIMDIEGINVPETTSSIRRVQKWLKDGNKVLARTRVKSMQGKGIVILEPGSTDIPECKLYTKFEPSTTEFRVYVLNGKVIDVLQKRRQNGTDDPGIVRTEENGWVFCRQNVTLPDKAVAECVKAAEALGLDFGGVDVLWNKPSGKATVLEINTAPGIFGSGIKKVGDAFISLAEGV